MKVAGYKVDILQVNSFPIDRHKHLQTSKNKRNSFTIRTIRCLRKSNKSWINVVYLVPEKHTILYTLNSINPLSQHSLDQNPNRQDDRTRKEDSKTHHKEKMYKNS